MGLDEKTGMKSATGWLIATYIFAILGGYLGIICGIMVYRDKNYKESHRNLGLLGTILSIISILIQMKCFS